MRDRWYIFFIFFKHHSSIKNMAERCNFLLHLRIFLYKIVLVFISGIIRREGEYHSALFWVSAPTTGALFCLLPFILSFCCSQQLCCYNATRASNARAQLTLGCRSTSYCRLLGKYHICMKGRRPSSACN